MPFKLKLKKTRQYNVASKSLFVISVELLDGGVADCTLSVDSSGQECLDNVCQRQAINQPEFFGLRYVNRSQQPRWVQLDRPLKRQLDKHASSHQLYLRVMYYIISGTSLITDEVTRYHYFLQLKNDLIEGRIICDFQQAVVLASYSRQAEYGNHDRERHTVEYLKNLLTFPKQMLDGGQIIDASTLAETGRLEWLTENVIQHHMALHNMSQAQAEEGFITTCQQLRGYGQEMFSASDHANQTEVTIAISLIGIRVLSENSDTPHFYRWMDITNVINHKRSFSIECHSPSESAMFTLASPEDGKYVWRSCVMQHTFYMKHQNELADEHKPNFQEHGLSASRSELERSGSAPRLAPLSPAHRAHSTSCLELEPERHAPPRNRALLPQYRLAPDYETAIQQKYQQQRGSQLRFGAPSGEGSVVYVNVFPLGSSSPELSAPAPSPEMVLLPVPYQMPRLIPLYRAEPIYENVPLPWARTRTRSLSDAPAIDRLSLDETPYQSLSTHRVSASTDNVTSVAVPEVDHATRVTVEAPTPTPTPTPAPAPTDERPSNKEKKRRRWGVFMGRKEVKSATLGRDSKEKTNKHRWSTGLPKFQPLPPSITKETMCQILERNMSLEALSFSFEQIPAGRAGGSHRTALAAGAVAGAASLPYDDNRVRLQPSPANPHGYINASHITMTVGSSQRFYIICGISEARCGDGCVECCGVWEAAWSAGAALLALVGPRAHAAPPPGAAAQRGKLCVSTLGSVSLGWGAVQRVRVWRRAEPRAVPARAAPPPAARDCWLVHYTKWTTQPVPPDVDSFLAFLSELNSLSVCGGGGGGGGAGPLLLMCSAGAGRSGTALAAHLLLDILDNNQELDIPRTIGLLHQQRANLIQNVQQYKFLHQLLLQYLKHSRLI